MIYTSLGVGQLIIGERTWGDYTLANLEFHFMYRFITRQRGLVLPGFRNSLPIDHCALFV